MPAFLIWCEKSILRSVCQVKEPIRFSVRDALSKYRRETSAVNKGNDHQKTTNININVNTFINTPPCHHHLVKHRWYSYKFSIILVQSCSCNCIPLGSVLRGFHAAWKSQIPFLPGLQLQYCQDFFFTYKPPRAQLRSQSININLTFSKGCAFQNATMLRRLWWLAISSGWLDSISMKKVTTSWSIDVNQIFLCSPHYQRN